MRFSGTLGDLNVMPPKRGSPADGADRVTIQDVAKAAGISVSSVSNYMNNRFHRLGTETRTRIATAIAELDFRPNQAARQLKTGKARVIALVVPSIVNPFNGQMVFSIEQAAVKAGYRVHLCNTMRDPKLEKEFLDNLAAVGVADLITIAPLNTRRGYYSAWSDLSIVAVDANRLDLKLARLDTVNLDHEAAIGMAVEHLFALGHRRIAYVTDPLITHSRVMRLSGFKKAMKDRELDDSQAVVLERHQSALDIADAQMVEVGRDAASDVAALSPRPTAIIAFNDMIALGLLATFRSAGIAVPKDMSIIGVDDAWISQLSFPALTTIRQPIEAMAAAAVESVLKPSAAPTSAGSDTIFLPELVIRDTCAKPQEEAATHIRKRRLE
jgi:DNA-binding LacI/PurR family transcriptional regulator